MTRADGASLTALETYAKLEAEATYHDGGAAPAQSVVLGFGARSLMIMGFDDRAIAHWPLASLSALSGPDSLPLVLAPDRVSPERLTLDDPAMIEAIGAVCPDLHAAPETAVAPKPPRRRWPALIGWLCALGVAGVALAQLDWDQITADLIDPAVASDLGVRQTRLVAGAIAGTQPVRACQGQEGLAALDRLLDRVLPQTGGAKGITLVILDDPRADALSLPGGRVLVTRGLLASTSSPEEVAGILAVETAHIGAGLPLRDVIGALDIGARMNLVTGASLNEEADLIVRDALIAAARLPSAADAMALQQLDLAELPRQPFEAFMRDLTSLGAPYAKRRPGVLTAFDSATGGALDSEAPFKPALGDRDWLALGNICDVTVPLGG